MYSRAFSEHPGAGTWHPMLPVLGPASPSNRFLKSLKGGKVCKVRPSVIANTLNSGPRINSSTITGPIVVMGPNISSSKNKHSASCASSMEWTTITPLPLVGPEALTTSGKFGTELRCCRASSRFQNDVKEGVAIPCRCMNCLAKHFEPSNREANCDGPKQGTPSTMIVISGQQTSMNFDCVTESACQCVTFSPCNKRVHYPTNQILFSRRNDHRDAVLFNKVNEIFVFWLSIAYGNVLYFGSQCSGATVARKNEDGVDRLRVG